MTDIARHQFLVTDDKRVDRYLCVIDALHETPKIKHTVHHVRILLNDARERL
jgi:hypothetical protein